MINLANEIDKIFSQYAITSTYPELASKKAKSLELPNYKKAIGKGRIDLRKLPLVTIDGVDAKDFDDAFCCSIDNNHNFNLTVVIADVSFFVKPSDALDQVALERGNSIYFPKTVFPMLPYKLSEDWCSLRPHEEKFGLACAMTISSAGEIKKYNFFQCVIKSKHRFTYEQAEKKFISKQKTDKDDISQSLRDVASLTKVLLKQRKKRGGLFIDMPQQQLKLTKSKIVGVTHQKRLFAHKVIEECMLAANTCAANFLAKHSYPFLYRVHEQPEQHKIERLQQILNDFGINIGKLNNASQMQLAIDQSSKQPALIARALQMNILRTLSRAQYTPKAIAHYGLGYKKYTHFTSPIRRYSDLLVHRAIIDVINHNKPKPNLAESLVGIGMHCTEREMIADRSSLELNSRIINKLQQNRLGEITQGVIVGMSKSGFFVLCSGDLEGMVKFSSIDDDYYVLNNHMTAATGRKRKKN